jgi:hypothetical protein
MQLTAPRLVFLLSVAKKLLPAATRGLGRGN